MNYKKLNLFLYPILAIVLFFTIPFNNNWLYKKILNNNFLVEIEHMDIESRNIIRFGYSYTVYEDISNIIPHKVNSVVLLPPNEYIKARQVNDLTMPEPALFYYFTGIRSVGAGDPDVKQANWVMTVDGPGKMAVNKMEVIQYPDSLIAEYKRFIK